MVMSALLSSSIQVVFGITLTYSGRHSAGDAPYLAPNSPVRRCDEWYYLREYGTSSLIGLPRT